MVNKYTTDVTHVVCHEPKVYGRILCAIAAGKWVLHHTYAEASTIMGEGDFLKVSGIILVDLDLIINFNCSHFTRRGVPVGQSLFDIPPQEWKRQTFSDGGLYMAKEDPSSILAATFLRTEHSPDLWWCSGNQSQITGSIVKAGGARVLKVNSSNNLKHIINDC